MIDKLSNLINDAKSILITSHLGPDCDSVSSAVALADILKLNFPDKKVGVGLEEEASNLSFINGYDKIDFRPLADIIKTHSPNLLIILDANNTVRCSRDPEPVKNLVAERDIKLAVIDHHELAGKDDVEAFINNQSPAVAQDIYQIFISGLKMKKPEGYAQTLLAGIYTDTGGFVYENKDRRKTFDIVADLIDDGASLEEIKNQLEHYTDGELEVFSELAKNLSHQNSYSFSYLSDDFTDKWVAGDRETNDYKGGCEIFVNSFIRNIEDRSWGFIVYRDLLAKNRTYSVSFRAVSGTVDVAAIARSLDGGGHKPAAGAKVKAESINEALRIVKAAIVK